MTPRPLRINCIKLITGMRTENIGVPSNQIVFLTFQTLGPLRVDLSPARVLARSIYESRS